MAGFIKRLIVIGIFVALAWVPGRSLLEDYMREKRVSSVAVNEESIIELNAEQLAELIKKGSRRNAQTILFYAYSTECPVCWVNLEDINDIAKEYSNERITVIAMADIPTTEQTVAFLKEQLSGKIYFKPLKLKSGESIILINRLRNLNMNYSKPPYIGLIHQDGLVTNLAPGPKRGNKIRAEIDRFIRN